MDLEKTQVTKSDFSLFKIPKYYSSSKKSRSISISSNSSDRSASKCSDRFISPRNLSDKAIDQLLLSNNVSIKITKKINLIKTLDAPNVVDDFYLTQLSENSLEKSLAIILNSDVFIYEYNTGKINSLINGDKGQLTSISWNSNNIIAIAENEIIELYDGSCGLPIRKLIGIEGIINVMDWNSWSLSAGGKKGEIYTFDIRSKNSLISKFKSHTQEICSLKWNKDFSYLASGSNDYTISILHNGKELKSLKGHKGAIKALCWPYFNTNLLISGGGIADKSLKIWNCINFTHEENKNIELDGQISSIIEKKGNNNEIIVSAENKLLIFNIKNKRKLESEIIDGRILDCVGFRNDNIYTTLNSDETLKFWQIDEQKKIKKCKKNKKIQRMDLR